MRRFVLGLLAAVTGSLSAVGALAHAFLDHAVPPVGGTVAASPPEIRLYFSEAIEPRFSGIELTSIDGRPVKTGPSTVDPRDQMQFVLPVPALPPRPLQGHLARRFCRHSPNSGRLHLRDQTVSQLGAKSWVRC